MIYLHSVHSPFYLDEGGVGGGVGGGMVYGSYQILGPESISVFRGRLMEKGVTFFSRGKGLQFLHKKTKI